MKVHWRSRLARVPAHQPCGEKGFKSFKWLSDAGDPTDHSKCDSLIDHGQGCGQGTTRSRDFTQAGRDRRGQRPGCRQLPGASQLSRAELNQQGVHPERMAPGVLCESNRLARTELDAACGRQVGHLVGVESPEDQFLAPTVVPSESFPSLVRSGPAGKDHHDSILIEVAHRTENCLRRRWISPVQVLDDNDHRTTLLAPGPRAKEGLARKKRSLGRVRSELSGEFVGDVICDFVRLRPDGYELLGKPGKRLSEERRLSRPCGTFDPYH